MGHDQDGRPSEDGIVEEMANYGITCIPIDNCYYREFHYTSLRDAIAQAIRDKVRLGLMPAA